MLACDTQDAWTQFLEYVKQCCSAAAFGNWLAPIKLVEFTEEVVTLEVPNIFVKEYLLSNYKKELCTFLPTSSNGEPSINFVIAKPKKEAKVLAKPVPAVAPTAADPKKMDGEIRLNNNYRFRTFIEGPSNQFVKSAAQGVATRPGMSYNPLFIHGGPGLGKTHMLHSIGHYVREHHKQLRVHCITTEAFINDLVDSLRRKSVDELKRFYRKEVDVLLVDDIQFLQNRLNFEEEFCNTFETLINQNKQIVITSDKPPGQLKLSERIIGRMEWGLVAHVSVPDLETRVAILQHKAETKGIMLPSDVAFFIAEHMNWNVRQLEGALNKLIAHSRLLGVAITEELVKEALRDQITYVPTQKITVDQILKSVAAVFQVRVSDLKGPCRTKEIALPRQVAMYLCKKRVNDSLESLAAMLGRKTHSTVLHGYKSIKQKIEKDETLRRQVNMVERHVEGQAR
jgi:chromosomal replication initiator protein